MDAEGGTKQVSLFHPTRMSVKSADFGLFFPNITSFLGGHHRPSHATSARSLRISRDRHTARGKRARRHRSGSLRGIEQRMPGR